MKLSVHLVTWNGAKYIPHLFASLRKQIYTDWKLVILDNGSGDDTAEKIKNEIKDFPVDVELIEGKENLGFAEGHNKLNHELRIRNYDCEYMLLLNQDMYLTPDCLGKMTYFLDRHENVAAVSPRLMKWNFNGLQTSDFRLQDTFTNKIDSLGLKVFRNRRVVEKYAGKDWDEVEPKMKLSFRAERHNGDGTALEVFGVSGALPMLRTSTIEKVCFSDCTFFDSLYNSYKEDVDLAFRLRIAGYKAFVLLDTVAYHDRTVEGLDKKGDKVAVENKKKQSAWVKYHSYKNHLMTLYKNEYWQNWILDAVFIKWYEFKKFMWFLIFDRSVLKGLGEIWKNRREIRNKKLEIIGMRKVGWREMRKWWS
ncbi:MAG: hypothetical protein COX81_01455 [Candidatus Magasanikbacteria bacterium CG_4_10_14_0_2_um_filter_37_12]|uniref:Glycosyltransferase 2-like domain-containing protein n=1 Tax=Candidatus Magasanikbacteria bacterium CG_4_10_14_0_2_um_filter_37_12 TaxID=1974637 RepID=A0A2M7V8W6_9BACT|nr:MAG: hypothetical protein COX81_01455 [Candidatus Magasanikbacteria bacterium CG_4_10_14_0_2_um_filter_37_12]